MELMKKVECNFCEKRYYVVAKLLPMDIKLGEAFPSQCPFCGFGSYAVLVD